MKTIIILLLLTTPLVTVNGQYIHHEISGSYGVITTDQVADVIKDVLVTAFSFGSYEKEDYNYSGALFLTYKNAVTYRLNLGASLGTDRVSGDLLRDGIKYGNFYENHTTVAAETDLRWVKKESFHMYSGLGLGYTFTSETGEISSTGETDTNRGGHVAIQLNALGMRVGKSLGAFLEFGFGYKGILNFGLSYRFE